MCRAWTFWAGEYMRTISGEIWRGVYAYAREAVGGPGGGLERHPLYPLCTLPCPVKTQPVDSIGISTPMHMIGNQWVYGCDRVSH